MPARALTTLAAWLTVAVSLLRADVDRLQDVSDSDSDVVVLTPVMADASTAEERMPDGPFIELQQSDVLRPATEELPPDTLLADEFATDAWGWQWLPQGLIYRSYMAGVHEPRMAIVAYHEGEDRTLWDPTLGGRVGLLRYGDCDPLHPQGFELDFYGAAVARLDAEEAQDLDSTDYVFGFPLTFGSEVTQYKFGYAHLSSHLGDELAIRDPDSLDRRVNYVRDALVLGMSHFPYPAWRMYGEMGWAFHNSGGARPWEGQFGTELTRPGPTGRRLAPFFAVNARIREEHNFGGDMAAQLGWLRRGEYGQTLRIGAQYYNGKSSQMQFFHQSEEQIGLGLWYDF